MAVEVEQIPIRQIKPGPVVQQTAYWARVKDRQGAEPCAFRIKADLSNLYINHARYSDLESEDDDILIILQQIDQYHKIAYVPYGPTMYPHDEYQGSFLEELSEVIRPHLPGGCILIRYDLNWESLWAGEDEMSNGNWDGPPEKRVQEMRFNFNTENWNFHKAGTDILPSNTIFLNLKKTQEELLSRMKPKTRYNIRLAARRGVQVDSCGLENIDIWYDLYDQTSGRNGIRSNDKAYFRDVLETRAADTNSPADVELLIASKEHQPLAAMFFVSTAERATYLYGASSNNNRRDMAPYALQWEAVKKAQQKGCAEYDMFGVSSKPDPSHPLYGLYRFKSGFGGEVFHRMGCWDYPLEDEKYAQFKAREMNAAGFHV